MSVGNVGKDTPDSTGLVSIVRTAYDVTNTALSSKDKTWTLEYSRMRVIAFTKILDELLDHFWYEQRQKREQERISQEK